MFKLIVRALRIVKGIPHENCMSKTQVGHDLRDPFTKKPFLPWLWSLWMPELTAGREWIPEWPGRGWRLRSRWPCRSWRCRGSWGWRRRRARSWRPGRGCPRWWPQPPCTRTTAHREAAWRNWDTVWIKRSKGIITALLTILDWYIMLTWNVGNIYILFEICFCCCCFSCIVTTVSGLLSCLWRVCYQRGLPRLVLTSW